MNNYYHKTERKRIKSENNPDPNIWSENPISNSSESKREGLGVEENFPSPTSSLIPIPQNPTPSKYEREPSDLNQLNLDTEKEQE